MGTANANIGSLGNNYPAYVKRPENYALAAAMSSCGSPEEVATPMAGFSEETLASLATLRRQPNHKGGYGNMEELDDAGTSFQRTLSTATMVHRMSADQEWREVDGAEYSENDDGETVAGAWIDEGGWY